MMKGLPWREAVELVEEQQARPRGRGSLKGPPHRGLALADVLRQQLRALFKEDELSRPTKKPKS